VTHTDATGPTDTTTSPDAAMAAADTEAIVHDYRRSLDVMNGAIHSADPNRWGDPSPCADWTARQVAGHAITFIRRVVALAGNGPAPDFHADVDFAAVAGDNPVATWDATRELVENELLGRPDRLAAVRMTPLGVEMPMAQFLTFQGMDPLVHGWDVAIATSGTAGIPDDLADKYVARFSPVAEQARAAGLLGPAQTGGATPAERLLDFCGRAR
jgi:uncharacterized protein (TIGR03086 family)